LLIRIEKKNILAAMQPEHRKREIHRLNDEGMVACNPRDKEAAHRAEVENIATEEIDAVTCRKCLELALKKSR
jgi:hypothetical protein